MKNEMKKFDNIFKELKEKASLYFNITVEKIKPLMNNSKQYSIYFLFVMFILLIFDIVGSGFISNLFMFIVLICSGCLYKKMSESEKDEPLSISNKYFNFLDKYKKIDRENITVFEVVIFVQLALLLVLLISSGFISSLLSLIVFGNIFITFLRIVPNLKKSDSNSTKDTLNDIKDEVIKNGEDLSKKVIKTVSSTEEKNESTSQDEVKTKDVIKEETFNEKKADEPKKKSKLKKKTDTGDSIDDILND